MSTSSSMKTVARRKVVRAEFVVKSAFEIPNGVDLDDKSVVDSWDIKWNALRIFYVGNDEPVEIESSLPITDGLKYPTGDYKIDDFDNKNTLETTEVECVKETNRKVVKVDYSTPQSVFKIPYGLDLYDNNIVKEWDIKYNILKILYNGIDEPIEIKPSWESVRVWARPIAYDIVNEDSIEYDEYEYDDNVY